MSVRRYVVFSSPEAHIKASWQDIFCAEGITYIGEFLPNYPRLIKKMHTAHCLIPFSATRKLPFKNLWYSRYFSEVCREGEQYVFVFSYSWIVICQSGYRDYLRKRYPGCRCVLLLWDINQARRLDMDKQKKLFDHIMVFERNFAKEHNIDYYPLVYSDYRHEIKEEEKDIDLLFVGWAKGRYGYLKRIYDRATAAGVNCQFYLTKLDEEVPADSGIHTADWVPYPQYKALLKRAKCLLDIVPADTDCNTLRVNEAMSHKCKILTNNMRIVNEAFYDPQCISTYASPEEIDTDFLLKPYTAPTYEGHVENMGPAALIRHLDKVLFEKGE